MTTIEDDDMIELHALARRILGRALDVPCSVVHRAAAGGLTDCYEATVDRLGYDPLAVTSEWLSRADGLGKPHLRSPWCTEPRALCDFTLALNPRRAPALHRGECRRCAQLSKNYRLLVGST